MKARTEYVRGRHGKVEVWKSSRTQVPDASIYTVAPQDMPNLHIEFSCLWTRVCPEVGPSWTHLQRARKAKTEETGQGQCHQHPLQQYEGAASTQMSKGTPGGEWRTWGPGDNVLQKSSTAPGMSWAIKVTEVVKPGDLRTWVFESWVKLQYSLSVGPSIKYLTSLWFGVLIHTSGDSCSIYFIKAPLKELKELTHTKYPERRTYITISYNYTASSFYQLSCAPKSSPTLFKDLTF